MNSRNPATDTIDAIQRAGVAPLPAQPDTHPSCIPPDCELITPEMLPLIELEQNEIQLIARTVPGGFRNILDIYPLTPLQEGMLLHHALRGAGDTYVVLTLLECRSNSAVDALENALQFVIDRHDTLRSAILWHDLPRPVQVVYRSARLPVEQLSLDPSRDYCEQMMERMRPELHRPDLTRAPLVRMQVASNPGSSGTSYALLLLHHLFCDAVSMETLIAEVTACIRNRGLELPAPVQFRNHVARTLRRSGKRNADAFFRSSLGDFARPSIPFGLSHEHGRDGQVHEVRQQLPSVLTRRLRAQSRGFRVSTAAIFHVACGLVVSHTSQLDDVVFGTVFSGRLQSGIAAQGAIGMFINTLPLRMRLAGLTTAEAVSRTHRQLLELLAYEQVELTVAHRCSSVPGSTPLFSVLLNYIRRPQRDDTGWGGDDIGISMLASRAWTNYPITFIVEDLGDEFVLVSQTQRSGDAGRILTYLAEAAQSVVEALENAPKQEVLALSILPDSERRRIIYGFNECHDQTGRLLEGIGILPSDSRIYILNERLQPVPIGIMADIYVGGPGVSAGYTGKLGLPQASVIADPFIADPAARMHRTAAKGKWRMDGSVEYCQLPLAERAEQGSLSSADVHIHDEVDSREFEPPQGGTEECLARIWGELLNIDKVGRNQSFFSLGGHSLLGFQLLVKVAERFGVQAPAISIFRYPTVRQMAQFLESLTPPAHTSAGSNLLDAEEGVI
jgi:acyl carrier protein